MKHTAKKIFLFSILIAALCFLESAELFAQSKKRVIQLSGMVFTRDTLSGGIPGVHVYVPKAGRGTTTNAVGFFSMPTLVGDSIVISSIGYARQFYIVPDHPSEFLTVLFELNEDETVLPEQTATVFPTEEVFKEAILALNIPLDNGIDNKNLNAELLALILKTTPMDGPMNQRYYLNQWSSHQSDKFMPVTNPFFNPFNWVKFFNSLKKDKKKKPQRY